MIVTLIEDYLSILYSQKEMILLEKTYKNDITKLERILRNQMRQKRLFQDDIKNLKLKTKSQHPIQFRSIIPWDDKGNEKIGEFQLSIRKNYLVQAITINKDIILTRICLSVIIN